MSRCKGIQRAALLAVAGLMLSGTAALASFDPSGGRRSADSPRPPQGDGGGKIAWSANCPRQASIGSCTKLGLTRSCTPAELAWLDSACAELLDEAQTLETAGWQQDNIMSVDEVDVVDGPALPAPVENIRFDGFHASYARQSLMARAACVDPEAETQRELERTWWESNCSVLSCEEYIFDKYYDYERFEDRIAPLGDDHRAIFNAIYGAEGIARKTLRSLNGEPLPAIDLGSRRDGRNAYVSFDIEAEPIDWVRVAQRNGFTGLPDMSALASSIPGCVFDRLSNQFVCDASATVEGALLVQMINAQLQPYDSARLLSMASSRTPSPPLGADWWDFHEQASTDLALVSDAKLLWLEARQRGFASLSARRLEVARSINEALVWMDTIEVVPSYTAETKAELMTELLDWLRSDVAALAEIDAQVIADLDFAERQGCLATGASLGPCDWSPRWPATAVQNQFLIEREADYQRCLKYTANNFNRLYDDPDDDQLHWLEQAQVDAEARGEDFCSDASGRIPGCIVTDNYVDRASMVEVYFSTVEAWFDSLPLPTDPETGQPILGQTEGDEAEHGDDLFAVSYGYGFGWQASHLTDGTCQLATNGHGFANLDATVFGYDTAAHGHLFHADGAVDVGAADHSAGFSIVVLGQEIYAPESIAPSAVPGDPQRMAFHFVEAPQISDSVSQSRTYVLGFVPVTFYGGLAGTVGVDFELHGEMRPCQGATENLESDTRFLLSPFASTNAFVAGLVGVRGASIGVRANITIFDLDLPFTTSTQLRLASQSLAVNTDLDINLTLLSGSVDLVAELAWKTYKRRLFGWSGLSYDTNLIHSPYNFPLDVLIPLLTDGQSGAVENPPALTLDRSGRCLSPVALSDPTLYLSFDNDTVNVAAQTVHDEINGYLFDYAGGVSPGVAGVFAQGFALNGSDGRVTAQPGRVPPNSADYTYAFWVKAADPGLQYLLQRGTDPDALRVFLRGANNDVVVRASCGGLQREVETYLVWADSPMYPGRNGYSHLAVVKKGDRISVYGNGTHMGSVECLSPVFSDDMLRFGERVDGVGGALYFGGDLDELVYYDGVALNVRQVRELYERGAEGRPAFGDGAQRPMGITGLSARAGDGQVVLSWSNPPDLGQAGGTSAVSIRASTGAAPRTLDDGFEVLGGVLNAGTHNGAQNGYTYHYTAFALRADGSFLRGPSVSATPTASPTDPVSDVLASPGDLQILLTWTNPLGSDFEETMVLRKVGSAPSSRQDGTIIYMGRGTEWIDLDVEVGTTYFYAFYAADWYYNWSSPVFVTAAPLQALLADTTPPLPVTGYAAEAVGGAIQVRWTNPPDLDFQRIEINKLNMALFRQDKILLGADESFTDTQVQHGTAYRYSIVAVDSAGNRSVSRTVQATATDGQELQAVSNFRATPTPTQIMLTWTNPSNADLAGVMITRSSLRAPSSPSSGEVVFRAVGTSHFDIAVDPGVTYYYSAFAFTAGPLYSAPVSSSATMEGQDRTPPPPVRNFFGVAGINSAILTWDLPVAGDLNRIEVRADTVPVLGPRDGDRVYIGLGSYVVYAAREPLYYAAFALDTSGNASTPAYARVTPQIPPLRVTADAGADQTARGGDLVRLSAQGSVGLDGQPLTRFVWRQIAGPAAVLTPSDEVSTRFVAPAGGGLLSFEVEVGDGMRADVDQVDVDVSPFVAPRLDSEQNPFATVLDPMHSMRGVAVDDRGYVFSAYRSMVWGENLGATVYDSANRQELSSDLDILSNTVHVVGDLLYAPRCVSGVALVDISDISQVVNYPPYVPPGCVGDAHINPRVGVVSNMYKYFVVTPDPVQGLVERAVIADYEHIANPSIDSFAVSPVHDALYISNFESAYQLHVWDLSTPASPTLVHEVALGTYDLPRALVATADFLVVDHYSRLTLYDLSTPLAPTELADFPERPTQLMATATQVGDLLAWVGQEGLVELWDLSTPSAPSRVPVTLPVQAEANLFGSAQQPPLLVPASMPTELWVPRVVDSYLPSDQKGGIRIFDLASVGVAPPYPSALESRRPFTLKVVGTQAVVLGKEGLSTVDLSSLPSMTETGFVARTDMFTPISFITSPLELQGNIAYAVGGVLLRTLLSFDLSDPANPALLDTLDLPRNECTALALYGDDLYIRCGRGVLRIDISDPAALVSLGYDSPPKPLTVPVQTELEQIDRLRWIEVEAARGVIVHPIDEGGRSDLAESRLSLPVSDLGPRDLAWVGDQLLVANGNQGLQLVDIDRLQLNTSYAEATVSTELIYPVTFTEPDPGRASQLVCEVSGGSCVVENLAPITGMMSATVRWTLPSAAGDHELMVTVGHEQYYVTARDRVKVTP